MAITQHANGYQVVFKLNGKATRAKNSLDQPITMTEPTARIINTMLRCLRRPTEKNMGQLTRVLANYPIKPPDFNKASDDLYLMLDDRTEGNLSDDWAALNKMCIEGWDFIKQETPRD